jgi:pyruvate/2-oxoglutarate dehydrogenase complex dihydrolipoamide dehydrogenase (E3) component
VTVVQGVAHFTEDGCVEVNGEKYTAEHILIATGSAAVIPKLPGWFL